MPDNVNDFNNQYTEPHKRLDHTNSRSLQRVAPRVYKVRDCELYITFDEASLPRNVFSTYKEAAQDMIILDAELNVVLEEASRLSDGGEGMVTTFHLSEPIPVEPKQVTPEIMHTLIERSFAEAFLSQEDHPDRVFPVREHARKNDARFRATIKFVARASLDKVLSDSDYSYLLSEVTCNEENNNAITLAADAFVVSYALLDDDTGCSVRQPISSTLRRRAQTTGIRCPGLHSACLRIHE